MATLMSGHPLYSGHLLWSLLHSFKYTVLRAVGSNFQLVRPRYCDHNIAACNRQGVGVGGDVPPSAQSAEALSVFILENQHCTHIYAPVD